MELIFVKDVEEDNELVMDDQDAIIISLAIGLCKARQLVSVEVKDGEMVVTCFKPVKIINQFDDKKSEAGHELSIQEET